MHSAPTYTLRPDGQSVKIYYAEVATFAEEVLRDGEVRLGRVVGLFLDYLVKRVSSPVSPAQQQQAGTPVLPAVRSREEALLELLNLGTLWRTYGGNAVNLPDLPAKALSAMVDVRKDYPCLKTAVDILRGKLATPFLAGDELVPPPPTLPTWAEVTRLLRWLEASGEFNREVERYEDWHAFMAIRPLENVEIAVREILDFAAWFEGRSLAVLGKYTANVQHFLETDHPHHHGKEDVILTGRRRVEYHLNMVGAEILNLAYRAKFHESKNKIVVAPACLRCKPDSQCEGRTDAQGLHCTACEPGCRVQQLKRMGSKYGFQVALFPHSGNFSNWAESLGELGGSVGVVGITCAVNLLAGGWEASAAGIPVQCVLLDYCGCQHHWDAGDRGTDFSFERLREVVGG